jgi:hypothetical protein
VSLTACAPGDIALEGKIFEVAGLAGTQQGGGRNVKMADRAPLIVPPDPNRLPVPGETGSTADADAVIASIDDPDRKRIKSKSDLEKAQAAYCKENYELAKARGDIATADSAVGPLGSCKPSIFSALKNWNATPDE